MAVWNQITTSGLVGALRIDPEFWHPAYVANEATVRALDHAPLGSLVSTFKKGIFYILAREYAPHGVPFYRSSNVGSILPKDEGLTYITAPKHQKEYKTALRLGDLMIVKTGKSGASILPEGECNVSQDVIATKVKRDRVNPYYLAVYLNTRFGSHEMNRWFQGQVQPHLSLDDARRILVPLLSPEHQKRIEELVTNSAELRRVSHRAQREAEEVLESHLRLDKLAFTKPVGYTASFDQIESARRLDAEHYFPAFKQFLRALPKSVRLAPLAKHLNFCQRGKQPAYAPQGLPVINSKHVKANRIAVEGCRFAEPGPEKELQIRSGDILINGTGRGTLGRTAAYLSDQNALPDNHVTILRSPTIDPVFLSLYLNSPAGQMQVEMYQRGTSGQLELYPFDLRKFTIWEAPASVQKEIRKLYDYGASAEMKSNELLDEAKQRVERQIEEAARKGTYWRWRMKTRAGEAVSVNL